jgi:hypothetical protein
VGVLSEHLVQVVYGTLGRVLCATPTELLQVQQHRLAVHCELLVVHIDFIKGALDFAECAFDCCVHLGELIA